MQRVIEFAPSWFSATASSILLLMRLGFPTRCPTYLRRLRVFLHVLHHRPRRPAARCQGGREDPSTWCRRTFIMQDNILISWPKATDDRPFVLGQIHIYIYTYIYIYINKHIHIYLGGSKQDKLSLSTLSEPPGIQKQARIHIVQYTAKALSTAAFLRVDSPF